MSRANDGRPQSGVATSDQVSQRGMHMLFQVVLALYTYQRQQRRVYLAIRTCMEFIAMLMVFVFWVLGR